MAVTFDIFFSATKPHQENEFQVVDYSRPAVHTLADGLRFEFSFVPEEPGSVDDYIAWYHPKPGDLVFDLGAHSGISVYHFSKMVGPSGRVVCFEPDPISLDFLRKNIARHHLENVTVVEAAIGGMDGTASFSSEGTLFSSLTNVLPKKPAGNVLNVPVMSLRTAFNKFGAPSLCKIDIEGAEVEALETLCEQLHSLETNFVVDTNHKVHGDITAKRVEAIFRRGGYETETIAKTGSTTYARPA